MAQQLPSEQEDELSVQESSTPHPTTQFRARMEKTGHMVLRSISFTYQDGAFTLRGAVPSYFLKALAQEEARQLDASVRIDNQLRVER